MRLLPSGDGADDLASSHRAPSPSHYDPDYDHTPYVYPNYPLIQPCPFSHSNGFPRDGIMCTTKSNSFIDVIQRLGESLCLRQLPANG